MEIFIILYIQKLKYIITWYLFKQTPHQIEIDTYLNKIYMDKYKWINIIIIIYNDKCY